MSTERRWATPEEVQARRERIDRLAEKVRASIVRKREIIARLRAEGRLPPEEPPRRV
jgi:hypothetical protein